MYFIVVFLCVSAFGGKRARARAVIGMDGGSVTMGAGQPIASAWHRPGTLSCSRVRESRPKGGGCAGI